MKGFREVPAAGRPRAGLSLHTGLVWTVLVSILVSGCRLPDLKPFADSTADLHQAVVQCESVVRDDLVEAAELAQLDPNSPDHPARRFSAEWQKRIAAMTAIVEYTDSLAAIADAGKTGEANAEALANSVNSLLGALSAPTAPDNYIAIAKTLYGVVAQVRAAAAFGKAVEAADPAIQGIATILIKDLADIENIIQVAPEPIEAAMKRPTEISQLIDYRKQLQKEQRRLESVIAGDVHSGLGGTMPAELTRVTELIAATDARYLPIQEAIDRVHKRTIAEIELTRRARDGFKQWAAIHHGLAENVAWGLRPNVRVLVNTVLEMKAIVEKMRRS